MIGISLSLSGEGGVWIAQLAGWEALFQVTGDCCEGHPTAGEAARHGADLTATILTKWANKSDPVAYWAALS